MSLKHTKKTHPQWDKNEHSINLSTQCTCTTSNGITCCQNRCSKQWRTNRRQTVLSFIHLGFFSLGKMALSMFPYPNQWPTVLSPCSVVAWQPGCDDKSFTLWFYGRLQKSVSIWPRVHHASHLFFKSQQNVFSTKQQVLADLFAEWAVIRYNLLAVISNHEDNKLVGMFFLFAPTSTYNCFIFSPYITLFLYTFLLLTCTFCFRVDSHLVSPVVIISQVLR